MTDELSVLDCPYFAVVIVTTVGYGDILPFSDAAEIFTSFYVLFALVIAGMAISQIVDSISNFEMAGEEKEHEALFKDKAKAQANRRMDFLKSVLTFLVLLVIGTAVTALGKTWDEGSPWVNGFYYTVITLTTVGFGDYSPDEDWEKVYKMVMMLVGIPVFGSCLGTLSSVLFAEQREELRLRLVKGGLTHEKFGKFSEFANRLADAGAGNDDSDGKISRFEFLTFVLVENGVIEMKNITNAMKNFQEIDKTKSGFIEQKDLDMWMEAHQDGGSGKVHPSH